MKKLFWYSLVILMLTGMVHDASARQKRPGQIPNGNVNNCANCHENPAGGGTRNAFGQDVEEGFLDGSGDVMWNYALAMLDSDNDGIPNGVELQDPNARWVMGAEAPGTLAMVRNPGDPASFLGEVLTVQFSGMTPHLGQMLEIRVVEQGNMHEVGRQKLAAIENADFQLYFDGVKTGRSYWVDFYADHNGNGLYDKPKDDHAWRIDVQNIAGDTIVAFSHNTDFTDIEWPYQLSLHMTGMNPHVGQKFEVRVIDRQTRMEVARSSLAAIDTSNFAIMLPGIQMDDNYQIDMYSDHNGNGRYDSPPADHAWRMYIDDVQGDTALHFMHNTGFTDIKWKYGLTVEFSNMRPHNSQKFELRVVDMTTQMEIGRKKVEDIPASGFEIMVPGIDSAGYYQVDFFADHNDNEVYDAPPADHAWRILSGLTSGDTKLMFSHNTGFTNIDWTYLVSLEVNNLSPHLGQLFQMRVVEQATGKEVGRAHLDSVYNDQFVLFAGGVRPNQDYHLDFFADHNNNGIYDAPPVDHAWRISFTGGSEGETELGFTHNTSFTNIDWRYQLTMHFSSMNPHIGQLLELRVVNQVDMTETGRYSLTEIPAANFSIPIGGIDTSASYNVDFYADHNGNRDYDPPTTDHAWRVAMEDPAGDVHLEFTHNTVFTDIGFPTAIISRTIGKNLPDRYTLEQNYPNPFNPVTTIRFTLPDAGMVRLSVYNTLGQLIATLTNGQVPAGTHEVSWDGRNQLGQIMSSGVYYYRIDAGEFHQVKRMLFIK